MANDTTMDNVSKRIQQRVVEGSIDATKSAIKNTNDQIVKSISKVTVEPLKQVFSAQGIGLAASRVAGNNPLVGSLVEGSISKVGGALGGLMDIIKDEKKKPQEEEQETIETVQSDIDSFEEDSEVKEILKEILHINELQLSNAKREILEKERNELKNIEAQRELSRAQEAQKDVLENVLKSINAGGAAVALPNGEETGGLKNLILGKDQGILEGVKDLGIAAGGFGLAAKGGGIKGGGKLLKSLKGFGKILLPVGVAISGFVDAADEFSTSVDQEKSNIRVAGNTAIGAISGIANFFDVGELVSDIGQFLGFDIPDLDLIDEEKFKQKAKQVGDSFLGMVDSAQNLTSAISNRVSKDIDDKLKEFNIDQDVDKIFGSVKSIFNVLGGGVGKSQMKSDLLEERLSILQDINKISQLQKDIKADGQITPNESEFMTKLEQRKLDNMNKLSSVNQKIESFNTGGIATRTTFARVGEGPDEAIIPIHRLDDLVVIPAIKKTLGFLQAQQENQILKENAVGGRSGGDIIAPMQTNVVTQQQATPFIAPKTKRNNENTFQRMSDLNNNSKLI